MYNLLKRKSKKIKKKIGSLGVELIDTKRRESIDNNKVLINDCQKLGNYVFKTPLIRGLAQNGYEVYLMTSAMTHELALANQHVKGIVKDKNYKKKSISIVGNIFLALKNTKKYSIYIECTGNKSLREVLFMRILKAGNIIACKRKKEDIGLKLVDCEICKEDHARLTPLNALKVLGIEEEEKYEDIELLEDKYKKEKFEKPLVLFNWKGSKSKTTLKYIEKTKIINTLKKIDKVELKEIKREKTTSDLCSLIKRASMVITVDTGILHIASAYNIPTIAHSHTGDYYKPTSSKNWVMDITSDKLKDLVISNF